MTDREQERAVSAITRALSSAEAVREAAAKVCEQQARDFLSPEYAVPQPVGSIQERFACAECAAAIRAMPLPEPPGAAFERGGE